MEKISGAQVKAARALLNWSQEDLAENASLTMTPISRMERGVVSTRKGTMKLIAMALEEVGIEFINEEGWVGVKLKLNQGLPQPPE